MDNLKTTKKDNLTTETLAAAKLKIKRGNQIVIFAIIAILLTICSNRLIPQDYYPPGDARNYFDNPSKIKDEDLPPALLGFVFLGVTAFI